MLKYTSHQLPNHLRGTALDRLKEKFQRERERVGVDEDMSKGIALHNARSSRHRRSATTLRKEAALQAFSKQRHASLVGSSLAVPSAGDLVTHLQQSRGHGGSRPQSVAFLDGPSPHLDLQRDAVSPVRQRPLDPFATPRIAHIDTRDTLDEDNLFRESILECIFKAIGLRGNNGHGNRDADSNQNSPRLVFFERGRRKTMFTNHPFGFMDGLEGSADGDTESMTSAGLSVPISPNPHTLAQDMRDDLEIVFFPKGAVLVEQGERNPGLYYVDGFLDMCTQDNNSAPGVVQATGRTSLQAMDNAQSLFPPNRSSESMVQSADSEGTDKKAKRG